MLFQLFVVSIKRSEWLLLASVGSTIKQRREVFVVYLQLALDALLLVHKLIQAQLIQVTLQLISESQHIVIEAQLLHRLFESAGAFSTHPFLNRLAGRYASGISIVCLSAT